MSQKIRQSSSHHLALDVVCIAFMLGLLLLGIANHTRVQDWPISERNLLIAAMLYCAASAGIRLLPEGLASTWALTASVTLLLSFLFQAMAAFQHVLVSGWMDGSLVSRETALTGTESTLFLQRFCSPWVTEWMMFAYVIYVPLLPVTALLCFRTGGPEGARDFLFNLALVNVACNAVFLLFPVAGPLFYNPEQYTAPLRGGFFTYCSRLLHAGAHYPGGSLPSPHCAATTVMLVMLYKHNRALFYVLLPTLATVYVATVYGRFHYVWDSIAGIVAAVAVLKMSPALLKGTASILRVIPALTMEQKGEQS
jgi:hypothetical protein